MSADPCERLLRQMAAGDERSPRAVVMPQRANWTALDRQTRALVQLSALLAADAATASLRWAVEIASSTGLDDAAMIEVMLSAASVVGSAQAVVSAQRLALALGLDLEVEGWDGT